MPVKNYSHTPAFYLGQPSGSHRAMWLRAELLDRLTVSLRELLPANLRSHCVVANIRGKELVIGADSPAWAARLRFHAPDILKHFSGLPVTEVRQIRIRTLNPAHVPASAANALTASVPRLSRRNSELLRQTAESVTDEDLRQVLNRLATRAD